jgi:succinate dehydrogenase cytochrome b556 subunit
MYRPLSPHSLIYKPQFCSVLSVFQRITGGVLSLGLLFVCFLFKFIIYYITFYPIYLISCYFNTYLAWIIVSIFIIFLFSFFYHLFNGIRHLFWDKAYFMSKDNMLSSAYLLIFFTLLFSVVVLLILSF